MPANGKICTPMETVGRVQAEQFFSGKNTWRRGNGKGTVFKAYKKEYSYTRCGKLPVSG